MEELRKEQAANEQRKSRTRRARTLLELRRAAIRLSPADAAVRQMAAPESSSSVLTTDSRSAASGHTAISTSMFPPAATTAAIEPRDLLPAYLRDGHSKNSFAEYDRLVDQLEASISARVEAVAREREHFYAMQKRVFDLKQSQSFQSERHNLHNYELL